MPVELRPVTALAVLTAVLLAGAAGSLAVTEATSDPAAAPTYLQLQDTEAQLWPYTSTAHSFDRATLAFNAIVYGDPADIRDRFLDDDTTDWNRTGPDERDAATDPSAARQTRPAVEWDLATGSNRYAYVAEGADDEASGRWLSVEYQIHDGTYLGSRHHIRAYTDPDGDGEWTAMQAHREHWDWFMGRHVVTSVGQSQSHLERELLSSGETPEIQRVPAEGTGSTIDRWLTIIDFRDASVTVASIVPVALFGAFSGRLSLAMWRKRERIPTQDVRTLLLGTGIATLVVGVRVLGVELEGALAVAPKTIAFALYPVLFVGLPVVTYLFARPLARPRAFAGASLGFVIAVLLDYTYLGVTQLSLSMLVYRGALAVALGLIAAGSSRDERRDAERGSHVRLGVLVWAVGTLLPLLRHTPLPV